MTYKAFQGDNGEWGVEDRDSVLYEPMFARITAEAMADMCNSKNPPKDWYETQERLDRMGLPY